MTAHGTPDIQATAPADTALLQVTGLARSYRLPRRSLWRAPEQVHALRGVDFTLAAGRSLGVVGESGSGKSTLARLVMALDTPSAGSVRLLGQDLHRLGSEALRAARRDFQMVFQDPYGSLDPRMTVEHIVCEPLTAQPQPPARAARRELALATLEQVGLRMQDLDKYPHEFSGGQRQRIAIARALVTRPRLIVADEPVSALDVSVQAQVLNLLRDLQASSSSAECRSSCSTPRSIPTPGPWSGPYRRSRCSGAVDSRQSGRAGPMSPARAPARAGVKTLLQAAASGPRPHLQEFPETRSCSTAVPCWPVPLPPACPC
jgi:peptide/nickel transport system ATP-binding protein